MFLSRNQVEKRNNSNKLEKFVRWNGIDREISGKNMYIMHKEFGRITEWLFCERRFRQCSTLVFPT